MAAIGILINGLAYSSGQGVGSSLSGSVLALVRIATTISTGFSIYFARHAITDEKVIR